MRNGDQLMARRLFQRRKDSWATLKVNRNCHVEKEETWCTDIYLQSQYSEAEAGGSL